MKSRIKRHILTILLFPLLLGACVGESPTTVNTDRETQYPRVELGWGTYRVVDQEYGYVCYTYSSGIQGGAAIECFKLDQ